MDRLQYEAFVNAYLDYRCFNTTSSRAVYEKAFRQIFTRQAISTFTDPTFDLDDIVKFNNKWQEMGKLLAMVKDSIVSSNKVFLGIEAFSPPNISRVIEKNIIASIDRKSKNQDSIEVLRLLLQTIKGFLEVTSLNKYLTKIQDLIFEHFKHLVDTHFTDDKEYNKVVFNVIKDAVDNTPIKEGVEYWEYSSSVINSATNILASKITDSITSSMMMLDDDEFYKETFKETVESLKIAQNDFLKRASKIENSSSNFLSDIGFTKTLLDIEARRDELIEKELNVPYQFEFSFSSPSFYRQGVSLTLTSSLNQLKDYISSIKKGNLSQLEVFNTFYGDYTLRGDMPLEETLRAINEFYDRVLKKYTSCSFFIDKDKLVDFITEREESVLTKFYNYRAKTFLGDTDFTVTVSIKNV